MDIDENTEDSFGNDEYSGDCVMAVLLLRQTIGISIYDSQKCNIYTTQFMLNPQTLAERIDEIITAMRPRLILTCLSTSHNEPFMDLITQSEKIEHLVTKAADWDYAPSRHRVIEHLHVRDLMKREGSEQQETAEYDNFQLLSSELSFEDRSRICSLGGLVSYLKAKVFTMEDHVVVRSLAPVESFLNGHCIVDPTTLRALSIFVEDFHPSQVFIQISAHVVGQR